MSDLGVPNFIRQFRKSKGLSQEALGAKMEPPAVKGTISEVENGKKGMALPRLFEIADLIARPLALRALRPDQPNRAIDAVWSAIGDFKVFP